MEADDWVEGLPSAPGDYWFYIFHAGYSSRVQQGSVLLTANNALLSVCGDVLNERDYDGRMRRVWHRPLMLPARPQFDLTCPKCEGSPGYYRCYTCQNKGVVDPDSSRF